MDVRGVLANRLAEQGVDQPDDGRVVVAFQQVGLLGQVLRKMGEVGVLVEAATGRGERAAPPS